MSLQPEVTRINTMSDKAQTVSSKFDFKSPLAVVAGSGLFPRKLIETSLEHGQKIFLCAHQGETDPTLCSLSESSIWIKVGQLGKIIRFLKKQNVRQVIFTGAISRAKLFVSAFPDWTALKVIRRAGSLKDDIILRAITEELEREGISVFSSSDVLTDFLSTEGCYTLRNLSDNEKKNALVGWDAAKTLGSLDIGQTAVVADGLVVALECIEGTDACIKRAGALTSKKPSVVVKLPKPQQDKRVDLPSVGVDTIQTMIDAGATALILESGGAMILNPDEVIKLANKAKIAIISVSSKVKILEDFYKKETS